MSKVEEVARAIRAKVPVGYGMTESEALDYARAAIEAMQGPTEDMVDAGVAADLGEDSYDMVSFAYRAMIDAALNEEG